MPAKARPKAPKKTAVKTGTPSPRSGYALPVGAHPGNTGGKKGRSGRKPDEFKQICQRLASRASTVNAVSRILKDDTHPAYLGALKWATENGYGRATESINVTQTGGLTIKVVHE